MRVMCLVVLLVLAWLSSASVALRPASAQENEEIQTDEVREDADVTATVPSGSAGNARADQRAPSDDDPNARPIASSDAPSADVQFSGSGDAPAESTPARVTADEQSASTQRETAFSPLSPGGRGAGGEGETHAPRGSDQKVRLAPALEDVHAAQFNGIQPGITTREELEEDWGPPVDVTQQAPVVQYLYELDGFRRVAISLEEGRVTSILVDLDAPQPADVLFQALDLGRFQHVEVHDQYGEPLGLAIPERGVLFSYDPRSRSQRVAQIILESIDAQAFVLRAELNLRSRCEASLSDIEFALSLDPDNARAHWLKARLLTELGRYNEAGAAAERAVELEENEPQYRLTLAEILGEVGRYEEAVKETRRAIDESERRPEVKARGLAQLGDQIAAGPDRDYKTAIDYHQQAIRLASPLVSNRRVELRRTAKRIMLDAHLAAASDVAWGVWKRKDEVALKWLGRATALADDLVDNEGAGDDPPFLVAREALAIAVGLDGKFDIERWVAKVVHTGKARIEAADDPLSRQLCQWELGLALYDAVQVYHLREDHQQALKWGEMAVAYLERGSPLRRDLPGYAYLMGRLYYRIGAIHAIEHNDHAEAVNWYERAVPLMEEPIPESALADIGRQGETLVSMAVSFWDLGDHDEALRLTMLGVDLMEQAVSEGILVESALAVPYHNLAQMHRHIGDDAEAETFERMAAEREKGQRR